MLIKKTKYLTDSQFDQINKLWNTEFPESLINRFDKLLIGIENYNHYILQDEYETIVAWAIYFEKDDEIRFSIIVDHNYQRKGYGKLLIDQLKDDLQEFTGWVIDHNNDRKTNGENYISPLNFYIKNGFEILPDNRIDNNILKAVKIKFTRAK